MIDDQLPYPRKTFQQIETHFGIIPEKSVFRIKIYLHNNPLRLREFGSFCTFLDSVYGRLTKEGLQSYSHSVSEHLKIKKIQKGSIQIVIEQLISGNIFPASLVVLWLILKYLPNITGSFKNITSAARDLEEIKNIRQSRKTLREQIMTDDSLSTMTERRRNDLVILINQILQLESSKLPSLKRFIEENYKDCEIEIQNKE